MKMEFIDQDFHRSTAIDCSEFKTNNNVEMSC